MFNSIINKYELMEEIRPILNDKSIPAYLSAKINMCIDFMPPAAPNLDDMSLAELLELEALTRTVLEMIEERKRKLLNMNDTYCGEASNYKTVRVI